MSAPLLSWPSEAPDAELLAEVARALAASELVALPTETVYGFAARADRPEALDALRALKGSDERAYTWHAPSAAALDAFDPRTLGTPRLAQRVAERYWPGPLTLVLEGVPAGLEAISTAGWTGVRVPSHAAARAALAAVDFPVVMTSANRAGEAPLTEAAAVAAAFPTGLACVVDGGPSALAQSSTVLALGRGRFEVLREGLVDSGELRRAAGLALGFVCTGNTCRSPMAEGLARDILARRLGVERGGAPAAIDTELARFGFRVASSGVSAGTGAPVSEHSVTALADAGIDISAHTSHAAVPEAIAALDHVYCLTASHRAALVHALPPGKAAHVELLDPEGLDIPDPIGGSLADYRTCAAMIRAAIDARADGWV